MADTLHSSASVCCQKEYLVFEQSRTGQFVRRKVAHQYHALVVGKEGKMRALAPVIFSCEERRKGMRACELPKQEAVQIIVVAYKAAHSAIRVAGRKIRPVVKKV